MPVLLFWFSSVTENSYEYSYGSVLSKLVLVDAAYLGASQCEHTCSLLQAAKMPWMHCLMTDIWTKFNAEFMKFGTKLRLKICQSWNHNFLYGILRNIENIVKVFKHYLKVMFSIWELLELIFQPVLILGYRDNCDSSSVILITLLFVCFIMELSPWKKWWQELYIAFQLQFHLCFSKLTHLCFSWMSCPVTPSSVFHDVISTHPQADFWFSSFLFSRDENPDWVEIFYDWLHFILYLHTWSISNDPLLSP